MGKVLGQVWFASAKIPADHPIVSNPVSEVRRRTAAGMTKLAGGERAAEDSAGAAHFGIEDFFDLGCGALSRFSNHGVRQKIIVCLEEETHMKKLARRETVAVGLGAGVLSKILTGDRKAQARSDCLQIGPILGRRVFDVGSVIFGVCVAVAFGCVAFLRTSEQLASPAKKGAVMTMYASGTFEVKLHVQKADSMAAESANLGRMTIEKQFHGDLRGTSAGEMLSAGTEIRGSAGYVAMERVNGTLGGRTGTFVLQHSGTMTRGEPQLSVSVVPDSGTGELVGIAGKLTIKIVEKKHFYEFEYTLPETP
jgi:hypothetical protein